MLTTKCKQATHKCGNHLWEWHSHLQWTTNKCQNKLNLVLIWVFLQCAQYICMINSDICLDTGRKWMRSHIFKQAIGAWRFSARYLYKYRQHLSGWFIDFQPGFECDFVCLCVYKIYTLRKKVCTSLNHQSAHSSFKQQQWPVSRYSGNWSVAVFDSERFFFSFFFL